MGAVVAVGWGTHKLGPKACHVLLHDVVAMTASHIRHHSRRMERVAVGPMQKYVHWSICVRLQLLHSPIACRKLLHCRCNACIAVTIETPECLDPTLQDGVGTCLPAR